MKASSQSLIRNPNNNVVDVQQNDQTFHEYASETLGVALAWW